MKYLSPQQILFIHDQVVTATGGSHGLRDVGLLESAAARPQASFGGEDLYPTIFVKAAALFHSLLKNHPFVDGNKRTSYATVGIFLRINGYKLENTHKTAVEFALKIENESVLFEDIAKWLEKNSSQY